MRSRKAIVNTNISSDISVNVYRRVCDCLQLTIRDNYIVW